MRGGKEVRILLKYKETTRRNKKVVGSEWVNCERDKCVQGM